MITFLLIWLILAIALGFMVAPVIAKRTRVCVPDGVTGIIAWTPGQVDGLPESHNQQLLSALYAMRGEHFGYRRGDYVGMHIPADALIEAHFTMIPGGQMVEFWGSKSEPEHIWIYWYPNDSIFTVKRPSGNYFGKHPCNDLKVTRRDAERIYGMVK